MSWPASDPADMVATHVGLTPGPARAGARAARGCCSARLRADDLHRLDMTDISAADDEMLVYLR
ncbi:MAG: hypothetical protein QOF38_3681 [Pseudonocardiales bacterium]|nr:hypothetical protein [Pseudonocardiales bacterium]MDT7658966.1 hypothetical protein [Pseudonocardiales bacterium]